MTPAELSAAKAAARPDAADRGCALAATRQLEVDRFRQYGVVTRAQLNAAGLRRHDIERLLRRRSLRQVHGRVYVDHTGPLSLDQRIWAAVLACAPAVICGPTLLSPDPTAPIIHIAVDASRRLTPPDGVRLHRVRGLDAMAQWRTEPPRMRREDAVLLQAGVAEDELEVVRLLTDAARTRTIGAARLRTAFPRHRRIHRRAFVGVLLDDLDAGVNSVLEWGYVERVERAHGLPAPTRQVARRTSGGKEFRDQEYLDLGVVIELDGRLNHDSWEAENRDAARDLADQAAGKVAVRLRWRQVFGTPCDTAAQLDRLLRRRGWQGQLRRCGPGCTLPAGTVE
ncbi:hypothetical protein [Nocardioides sp. Iso805N]|uniref:hypothetical protein n=1 Tax=Nocardioides sp. Iso805N TaxID=1283287 RepID=UPI000374BA39|nr:hypothetical protein [Nocardioides sp. Iso805N]